VDIVGDHLVAVVWRGRPHLFWVTFLEKPNTGTSGAMTPQDMAEQKISDIRPPRKLQIQLNWTEYFQGQWTARASSGFTHPMEVEVDHLFDTRQVLVHASVEPDGAVRIHLNHIDFPKDLAKAFRVVSRHAAPTVDPKATPYPDIPYWADREWGRHHMHDVLMVEFVEKVTVTDGVKTEDTAWETILDRVHDFRFTTPDAPPAGMPADLAELVSPFFLADERHTFYVEPVVTETTVDQWNGWVPAKPPTNVAAPNKTIIAQVPAHTKPVAPKPKPEPDPVGPAARYAVQPSQDWLISSAAVVHLDGTQIGATGATSRAVLAGVNEGIQ
jgi:hypothetical protein